MSDGRVGPQVLDTRRRVHFELQQYQRAISFLESQNQPDLLPAVKALVERFIRPLKRGEHCCAWAERVGPCRTFLSDNSGGFCIECGHHKSCHRTFVTLRGGETLARLNDHLDVVPVTAPGEGKS